MKVTTERLENCQVSVTIEMDAATISKELRRTARRLSREYNIPGYRKGKAPYHAVVRVFGRELVQQQAIEDFGNDLYDSALDEIEYEPYEVGELQNVEWDPFRMTVLVPIRPQVALGDYRGVRVPFESETITEEKVEDYLKELQQDNAQWVPVDRAAALADLVVIDAEGTIGDEVVLSDEERELILEEESNVPLPGFHGELIGMQPGEAKTFTLAYPEDDPREDVAGKEASFTVTLHTVKEHDLPPLDDDLAMMVGDYDSLDALRAAIRENLETEALQQAEAEYLDKVLDAMIEIATQIEYPPQAVDREADMVLNQMESNLASTGLQLDNYLTMIGKTRETYKEELRPTAEERLKKRLVLKELARREGLEADSEQIEAEIDRLTAVLGDEADELQELLGTPEGRQSVADDLVITQVQERAKEIARGEAPPLEDTEAEVDPEPESELAPQAEAKNGEETESESPPEEKTVVDAPEPALEEQGGEDPSD
jgi:trigger factor